jgi:hypothetical protein
MRDIVVEKTRGNYRTELGDERQRRLIKVRKTNKKIKLHTNNTIDNAKKKKQKQKKNKVYATDAEKCDDVLVRP